MSTSRANASSLLATYESIDAAEFFQFAREAAREARDAKFDALDAELAEARILGARQQHVRVACISGSTASLIPAIYVSRPRS